MSAIKFTYLYRDAANYKNWGEVVFCNPEKLPLDEIESRLKQAFESEEYFIASQIGIPEVFLADDGYELNKDDHCYHQFNSVELTEEKKSANEKRSIKELIETVELQSKRGWEVFDPELRAIGWK